MNLAETLKALRLEKGLTQRKLSEETGLSVYSINSYETGRREPNSRALAVLERYFQVSGDFLLGNCPERTAAEYLAALPEKKKELISLFNQFLEENSNNPAERQRMATTILNGVMGLMPDGLPESEKRENYSPNEILIILSAICNLNAQGRAELAKRAGELAQLSQYQRQQDEIS
ncbi:helix-turn-helix transcriptional regulator [Anaerolentibacter hominis]|uniref:helix-turn-helix domain-containing protein n=1 Tax=Anaerolentibacter hominis TaxID=3079009 RepID=UPI0031B8B202